MKRIVVYSDLDGTLLDERYSFSRAEPALKLLKGRGAPIILCSSKTRHEIQLYQRRLGVGDPHIVENGAAIFIPKNYFKFDFDYDRVIDDFLVLKLGERVEVLNKVFLEIKKRFSGNLRSITEMSAREFSRDSGLPPDEARLAQKREYSITFKIESGGENACRLRDLIREAGLHYTRGLRYYHLMGDNDKGRAVGKLTSLYRRMWPGLVTVGLGDSLNDLEMLRAVDTPIIVQKSDGSYENIAIKDVIKAEGVGPAGWNNAMTKLLQ